MELRQVRQATTYVSKLRWCPDEIFVAMVMLQNEISEKMEEQS